MFTVRKWIVPVGIIIAILQLILALYLFISAKNKNETGVSDKFRRTCATEAATTLHDPLLSEKSLLNDDTGKSIANTDSIKINIVIQEKAEKDS